MNDQKQSGFTFVEMMVVIMITFILFGSGYANFREYSRRKSLEATATQIASDIKLAKEYAFSAKKDCTDNSSQILNGYVFRMTGANTYEIISDCTGNGGKTVKSGEITGATIAAFYRYNTCPLTGTGTSVNSFTIKSLGEGLDLNRSGCVKIQINQTSTNNKNTITVLQTGVVEIKDGGV